MIKITITNSQELLRRKKSRLVARLAPYFMDVERKVEEIIVAKIEEVFRENDVKAVITIEKTPPPGRNHK